MEVTQRLRPSGHTNQSHMKQQLAPARAVVIQTVKGAGRGVEMLAPLQPLRGWRLSASERLCVELGVGCTPLTPKPGGLRQPDL